MSETIITPVERVKLAFESTTCSRCGGSGHYSYCQRYGTRCFKCAGKGTQLTKRGSATRAYWQSLLTKPATEVKAGDRLYSDKWRMVKSVEHKSEGVYIQTNGVGLHLSLASEVMSYDGSVESWNEIANEAHRYQETLTKAGKPRKR